MDQAMRYKVASFVVAVSVGFGASAAFAQPAQVQQAARQAGPVRTVMLHDDITDIAFSPVAVSQAYGATAWGGPYNPASFSQPVVGFGLSPQAPTGGYVSYGSSGGPQQAWQFNSAAGRSTAGLRYPH